MLVGCGGTDGGGNPIEVSPGEREPEGVPVLGSGQNDLSAVDVATVVGAGAGLKGPRDIEFNPRRDGEAWIVNRKDHSAVVVTGMGTESQSSQKFDGANSRHFLAKPAALAFGQPGRMATAQQENKKTQPSTPPDFMGVTLWTTELDSFSAGHTSHYDMMHNSPLASGIAWEKGNAYWVFDGAHGSLTRYDFKSDHGPGGRDHTDGVVRRYLDDTLKVVKGVVGHVDLDRDRGVLYAADTGNSRVVVLNIDSGEVGKSIFPNYDGSDQKYVRNAQWKTLIGADAGLERPAGLELHDGRLFVADNATATVHAFTSDGKRLDSLDLSERIPEGALQGIGFDSEGNLYAVNSKGNSILRVRAEERPEQTAR
ncbi:MAG: hypothetical protein ABEL76_02560 [Bradymonadaceae bacterium]